MSPRLIFGASLCFLVSLASIAMMHFQFFPYRLVRGSLNGLEAFWEVYRSDQANFLFIDESGQANPVVHHYRSANDGDGYIANMGGPGTLSSHCPELGCMAWIMNRDGEILHTWQVDAAELWAESPHDGIKDHNKITPSSMYVYDNGDVIVSFGSRSLFPYGVGIAKFDKNSNVIWKRANYAHHWFSVAPDGSIFTPAHELADSPLQLGETRRSLECAKGQIYSDVILRLDVNGETIETIRLFDILFDAGLEGLVSESRTRCDPLHLNYVEYVNEQLAKDIDGLDVGDLIISLRHVNAIIVLDAGSRNIKWHLVGRTIAQHSPRLAPGGRIVIFDNYGGDRGTGGSRIATAYFGSERVDTIYPGPNSIEDDQFFSSYAGVVDLNPDYSKALVSITEQGRVLEIDMNTGEVLWEYVNNHDLGVYPRHIGNKKNVASRMTAHGAWYIGQPKFLSH